MKKAPRPKKIEIVEAQESAFGFGLLPALLMVLAAGLATVGREPWWSDWIGDICLDRVGGRPSHMATMLVTETSACVLGIFSAWLAWRRKLEAQPLRDGTTAKTRARALFLRPFHVDREVVFPNPHHSFFSGGFSVEPPLIGVEEFVARVLEPYMDVIEMGGDKRMVAGTRLHRDEDTWREALAELIHSSEIIVVLPSIRRADGKTHGATTIWEISRLDAAERLGHTIVLMPKAVWPLTERARTLWEQGRAECLGMGVQLPPYDKRGTVLIARGDAAPAWTFDVDCCEGARGSKRLAVGLVRAAQMLADRHGFALQER